MNIALFVTLLFSLQCFYWWVGRYNSGEVKDQSDYFLAGQKVHFFPLTMTFLAAMVGGGFIVGAAEEAYLHGWAVFLYPLGGALGLILLGLGVGRKLAEMDVTTVAEIFEVTYGSVRMRRCASILSIISLFMMLVAQITASHKFLTSFGFDYLWLFILFWTIVIIYTAQGGLKAVIATDVVQVLFFSIVFLVSFSYIITALPTATLQKLPMWEHSDIVSAKAYGWLLMPLLFIVVEQDMGQRCFAASSPQIAARSALSAGIITLIICTIPIFLGVLGSTMAITIPAGSSVLMTVIAHVTNPWATALMGCAVMAAIISTATSLINAIGSNLAHDFKLPTVKGWTFVYQAQAITCGISISAIFCAFYFNAVVDLLIQSCEFSVSCLFVPVLLAVLRGKGSFLAALLAMVFGITGFFILRLYPLAIPKEIASILLALCGYSLGEVLTYQLGITTSNEPIENNAP